MKNYQFRTNWLGHLVLQRRVVVNIGSFGDREYYWCDADTTDLQHYYATLAAIAQLVNPVPTTRDLFEAECG